MQSHATAPSSPTRHTFSGDGGEGFDEDGGEGGSGGAGHYFFSAPASPVHYILRSPPCSTAAAMSHYAPSTADGDWGSGGAGDFEFAGAGAAMSSAEELFLAGRIRVGCLSPILQEMAHGEEQEDAEEEGGVDADGHAQRPRRTKSASPPRTPRLAKSAEPSYSFASSSSSSSASSSSVKSTRRRISLRDLLSGSANDSAAAASQATAGARGGERSGGLWPPSIWPSRSKKALPYPPPPHPGRRSTSSDRASPAPGKRSPEAPRRRTTSLPYRQGLVLGCLGFGARSYGLAKSINPLSSR